MATATIAPRHDQWIEVPAGRAQGDRPRGSGRRPLRLRGPERRLPCVARALAPFRAGARVGGPDHPDGGGPPTVPAVGVRGADGKARRDDRRPQLRARGRRDHSFLGHLGAGRGRGLEDRREALRGSRLRRGGAGHGAPPAAARGGGHDLRERPSPLHDLERRGRPVDAHLGHGPRPAHHRVRRAPRARVTALLPLLPAAPRRRVRHPLAGELRRVRRAASGVVGADPHPRTLSRVARAAAARAPVSRALRPPLHHHAHRAPDLSQRDGARRSSRGGTDRGAGAHGQRGDPSSSRSRASSRSCCPKPRWTTS